MINLNEVKYNLAMLGMVRLGEVRLGMARKIYNTGVAMDKNEALSWFRRKCPPEFFKTLEYFCMEDVIHLLYDNGLEIRDRVIHVEETKSK